MSTVGISKLFYAELEKDELNTVTFKKPVYLAGVISFDADIKTNTETLYAENKAWESESAMENIELKINVADLKLEDYSKLLGHKLSNEGGLICHVDDVAPYVALLIEADKSNGVKSYRVYYKGKFTEPKDNAKTKEGKVDFQTKEISCTFMPLASNGMWKYQVDSDSSTAPKDLSTKFFESVIIPTKKAE